MVLALCCAHAEDLASEKQFYKEHLISSINYQYGKIDLPNGIATLNLPASFRYLSPEDAEKVIVDTWENPPGSKVLGMILPTNINPLEPNSWGIVITHREDGYIKDSDADSIHYDDLLKDMQTAVAKANVERTRQGYPSVSLVGWAEPPAYDKSTHKLYWAKEFASENNTEHALNYNIRILGRKGVLVLNVVAGMNQMNAIKNEVRGVVAFAEFTPGNRYEDFDIKTDYIATYGLATLVAGVSVAVQLGFFEKLFTAVSPTKKIILLAIAALITRTTHVFRRSNQPKQLIQLAKPEQFRQLAQVKHVKQIHQLL